jgi:YT521-B-like domain
MGVNNRQKPKGRINGFNFFDNENFDGLSELNRGPRTGRPKVQSCQTDTSVNGCTENGSDLPAEKDCYNRDDFADNYVDAKFFVIKSYSEDDVHKSVKYGVWASTPNGNKKLDAAYKEAKVKADSCPVFLFFSVSMTAAQIHLFLPTHVHLQPFFLANNTFELLEVYYKNTPFCNCCLGKWVSFVYKNCMAESVCLANINIFCLNLFVISRLVYLFWSV